MTRTTFLTTIPAAVAGWLGLKRWTAIKPPTDLASGGIVDPSKQPHLFGERPGESIVPAASAKSTIDWKLAQVNFAGKWYNLGTLGIIKLRDRPWNDLSKEEQDAELASATTRHRIAEVNLHSEGDFSTFKWLQAYHWGPVDRTQRFRFWFGEFHGVISQRGFTADETGKILSAAIEITEKPPVLMPMPEPIMGADGNVTTHHPLSCHCGYCRDFEGKQWPVMSTTMELSS
jgi:hypothetical protein